jgi:hypothetical protein
MPMQAKVGNNGEQELAKRRGWDEVVRLLAQYPETEERMKQLIKKRLGK